MSARQRLQQAQNAALAKARSKIHGQSDFTKDRSHILKEISEKTFVPSKTTQQQLKYAVLATRSAKADEMAERFRREGKLQFKDVAEKALGEIPVPYSMDDDPSFVASAKIVRAASKLGLQAESSPVVENATSVILRHTYLVQHQEATMLAQALPNLYSASTKDSRGGAKGRFQTLLPRLRQLAPDALVSEAAAILSSAARLKVADVASVDVFAATVRTFHADASTSDVCKAVESITRLAVTGEPTGEGPLHEAASALLRDVAEDLCERTGTNALAGVHGVILLTCMGQMRDVVHRRLALHASDTVMAAVDDISPKQCAETLAALSAMDYTHPALTRRLCSQLLLAAPHLCSADVATALTATAELPSGVLTDVELLVALLERIAELDASLLSIRDATLIMKAFYQRPIDSVNNAQLGAAKALLKAVAAGATPSQSDRVLVDALHYIEALKWHRIERHGPAAISSVASEFARRGGLPADNSNLLRTASDAVENILNDTQAANIVALTSALESLVAA